MENNLVLPEIVKDGDPSCESKAVWTMASQGNNTGKEEVLDLSTGELLRQKIVCHSPAKA